MIRIIFLAVFSVIVAVSCNELSILKSPKAIEFRGTSKVLSDSLADIFSATLGYSVQNNAEWDGMYISDPFNLATGVVAVVIEGIPESPIDDVKTYELAGSSSVDSLNEFLLDVIDHKKNGFHMDLKQSEPFVTPLGEVKHEEVSQVHTHYLKPKSSKEDRNILDQISYINKLSEMLSTTSEDEVPTAITIHVSLEAVTNVHGSTSPAFVEATKLLARAIDNLAIAADKAYNGQSVIAVIATDGEILRAKRQAVEPKDGPQPFDPVTINLADTYDEAYPVMFNIMLWFSVVMIFSLAAIAYAIGGMDPGRDSIIYRMTSTRMKKDN